MKISKATILLFICQILASLQSKAQEYIYETYTAANGLPSSEVLALEKDDKGFLWIGTASGLSKYDGYSFQNHYYATDNSLIGFVNVIKQYKKKYILIGTSTGLFIGSANTIYKLSNETGQTEAVADIFIQKDDNLLIATAIGPLSISGSYIDTINHTKINLSSFLLKEWEIVADKPVSLIRKTTDGAIFIAQQYSIFRIHKNKLEQIYALSEMETHDRIISLFAINSNLVFFDGSFSEINKIENGKITNYPQEKIYTPGLAAGNDSIWYAGTAGIFCFHPSLVKSSVFINTMDAGVLWPSMMLKEKDFFWLATHDGLLKIKPALFKKYNNTKFLDETYSAFQLKNNSILFGGNRGNISVKNNSDVKPLLPNNQKAFPLAEIRCIQENKDRNIWMGSGYQGLSVYANGKLKQFTKQDGLHDNSINNFFISSKGDFYAVGDNGISQIITDDHNNVSFKAYKYSSKSSQHGRFYNTIEAPDGTLWLVGEEGIFFLRNETLIQYKLFERKTQYRDIKKDSKNNIWIATESDGILLCKFNDQYKLSLIKKYTDKDGLNTNSYLKLVTDKQDNIWAGSAKGISCIVQNSKLANNVVNFDEKDGFIKSGYGYLNLFEANDGHIWVTTPGGTASFNPDDILHLSDPPEIYITNISFLKNPQLQLQTDSLLLANADKAFTTTYNNNSLTFSFTATDFSNRETVVYYYKLETVDTNWLRLTNTRNVTYQNLSAGKYKFSVRAYNSKGQKSKNDASFSFIIAPPFWKTWWFISLSVLFFSALSILIIKKREKNITRKEAQKTELEKLRTVSFQYQLEIEQVINFFATSINEQETIDKMLWDVTKNCISKLGFEDCVIYLKDEQQNVLLQKAAWGPKTTDDSKIINPIEVPVGHGIVGSVAASGKTEIIADTTLDNRYITDDDVRFSELSVPIKLDGKIIGVIDSEHYLKNFYTQRHVQILTTIASLCAEKIDKMNAEQTSKEKQLEVLQLNSDLANSQLTALRAQMNPHFIFNALNSIQQFVLQGNADEANRYLSRFSKLQREILNNSDQQFIPLEKEKEMLDIYLELEQLRFRENFSFTIHIDETIDTDEITIPPMIIQPFVENAIWHGLMPKQGNKQVRIEFGLQNDNFLVCTITDNGIGREAAAQIKAEKETGIQHKSKGLSLVYDRLKILEKQFNQPFEVIFEDLSNSEGNSTGTKVTLNLYIGY